MSRCPRTRSSAPCAVSQVMRASGFLFLSPGRIDVVRTTSPSAPVLITSSSKALGSYRCGPAPSRLERSPRCRSRPCSAAADGRDEVELVVGLDRVVRGEPPSRPPHTGEQAPAEKQELAQPGFFRRLLEDDAQGRGQQKLEVPCASELAAQSSAGSHQ